MRNRECVFTEGKTHPYLDNYSTCVAKLLYHTLFEKTTVFSLKCALFLEKQYSFPNRAICENVTAEMKIPKECKNAGQLREESFISGKIIPTCNCDNVFQISYSFSRYCQELCAKKFADPG